MAPALIPWVHRDVAGLLDADRVADEAGEEVTKRARSGGP